MSQEIGASLPLNRLAHRCILRLEGCQKMSRVRVSNKSTGSISWICGSLAPQQSIRCFMEFSIRVTPAVAAHHSTAAHLTAHPVTATHKHAHAPMPAPVTDRIHAHPLTPLPAAAPQCETICHFSTFAVSSLSPAELSTRSLCGHALVFRGRGHSRGLARSEHGNLHSASFPPLPPQSRVG